MSAPVPELCWAEHGLRGAMFGWSRPEHPELARRLGLPDPQPRAVRQEERLTLPQAAAQVDADHVHVLAMTCDHVHWHAEDTGARGETSVFGRASIPWLGATRMTLTAWEGSRRGITLVVRRASRIQPTQVAVQVCRADLVRVRLIASGARAQLWRIVEDGDAFIARQVGPVAGEPIDLRVEAGLRRVAWAFSDPALGDPLVAHFWFTPGAGVEWPRSGASGAQRVRQGIQQAIWRALPGRETGLIADWGWSRATHDRMSTLAQFGAGEGIAPPPGADVVGWVGLYRAILLKRAAGLPSGALPDLMTLGAAPTFEAWLRQALPQVHGPFVSARTPMAQVAALALLSASTPRSAAPRASGSSAEWSADLQRLLILTAPWRISTPSAVAALGSLATLELVGAEAFPLAQSEADELNLLLARLAQAGSIRAGPPAEIEALRRALPTLERLRGRFSAVRDVLDSLLPGGVAATPPDARVQVLTAFSQLPVGHGVSPRDLGGAWTRAVTEYRELVRWLRQAPGEPAPDPAGLADYQPRGATPWLQVCDQMRHLAEVLGALPGLREARRRWQNRYSRLHSVEARDLLEAWLTTEDAEDDPRTRATVNDWLRGQDLPEDYDLLEALLSRI